MSKHIQPIPDSWVDRLFLRMTAIYGTPKMEAMWGSVPEAERRAVWAEKLGRFNPESIAAAINSLCDVAVSWPPTLGEFIELVKESSIERAMTRPLALPDDSQCVDPARARALLREAMANMRKQP